MKRTVWLAVVLACANVGAAQAAALFDLVPAGSNEFVLKEVGGSLVCAESSRLRLTEQARAVEG